MVQAAEEVDVLIVGAGPAGLMLATWLAKLKVKTKIIDKRPAALQAGQADGVQCRTVEVFQSFGFSERLVEEVLTQGRIERFLLDAMKGFDDLTVTRPVVPISFNVDSALVNDFSSSSYPITATIRHLSEEEATPAQVGAVPNGLYRSNVLSEEEAEAMGGTSAGGACARAGQEETVKAKFMVGCDGARSWVRKQLGLSLEGESANSVWGVLDAICLTDFPDIRLKCTIHSKESGSILVVPREKDLVRFYVQLGSTKPGERIDRSAITPGSIVETAQRIFYPYKLECPHLDWWTVYEVGQRLCSTVTLDNRVFLAGDAFHTHSPKAGQGMNTSMMDAFNLGWKVEAVLRGKASPDILQTYSTERHKTAQELIDLDYQLSRMFAAKPKKDENDGEGVSLQQFKEFFTRMARWASGTAVHYHPNLLIEPDSASSLACGLPAGERFESHMVVAIADARPWHLADRFISDGRWRVVFFAGDIREREQRLKLEKVAAFFDSPSGPLRRFTPAGDDLDSVIELLTVISNPRTSVEPTEFPEVLWPPKKPWGSRAYDKLYADDSSPVTPDQRGEIYKNLQIDPRGCLVVVRPDQTVSLVCSLDEPEQVGAFFSRFLVPQQ
ncbi:hypothetical protein JCM10213v2_004520 [Rhodosporidiobolus nylandii]